MRFETAFRTLLAGPLEAVTGQVLQHVTYWLLDFDKPGFRIEDPNMSGLSAISMFFGGKTLELYPFWDTQLRGSDAYHIQARQVSGATASKDLAVAEHLTNIAADETTLWRDALGKQLVAVDAYGFGFGPHVIRFSFPSASVVVAVGYSGEVPLIGDGDEILVFPDEQWRQTKRTLPKDWVKSWECKVPSS